MGKYERKQADDVPGVVDTPVVAPLQRQADPAQSGRHAFGLPQAHGLGEPSFQVEIYLDRSSLNSGLRSSGWGWSGDSRRHGTREGVGRRW